MVKLYMSSFETKSAIITLVQIATVAFILTMVVQLFNSTTERIQVVECLKLKQFSEQFDRFWLTQWQKDMCDHQGIQINAPIGNRYEK